MQHFRVPEFCAYFELKVWGGTVVGVNPMHSFGVGLNLHEYRHRHSVFGVVAKQDKISCVVVRDDQRDYFDLPGGGLKSGESEQVALVREFEEETGLLVQCKVKLAEAGQYFVRSDQTTKIYSHGGFWSAEQVGFGTRRERNHRLCWLDPAEAVVSLRQESHAWFVLQWLRWSQRKKDYYRAAETKRHWQLAERFERKHGVKGLDLGSEKVVAMAI